MDQPFNSPAPAPAPATDASFDVYTGDLSVKFPEAATPTTGSITDLALTGSLQNYINLGVKGGLASAKTPGYPNSWVQQTMDGGAGGWPGSDSQITQGGSNLPGLIGLNIKDDSGQLYEVVYVDDTGKSRDIYKSSTLESGHDTSLTPGGVKIPGKKVEAPAPSTEGESSLLFNISSCCSSFVYCAGLVFLASMIVPKR